MSLRRGVGTLPCAMKNLPREKQGVYNTSDDMMGKGTMCMAERWAAERAALACCREKGLRRCAMCAEYPCDKLTAEEQRGASRRRKLLGLGFLLLALGLLVLVAALIGRPLLRYADEPEVFRLWVEQHGYLGPLAYMAMVAAQVLVAVIPGEPLEILGGYTFGAVEGTLLCLLGATAGSLMVFGLVRRFGMKLVDVFFSREKLKAVRFLQRSKRRNILFLLIFMIPGTPKDLLCYFAGLTDIKLPELLLICSLGRLPSVLSSTVGGDALGEESYVLAIVVFAVTLGLSAAGLGLYQRICKRNEAKEEK